MSLRDIEIKHEYRSLLDNMVKDFYIPLLSYATSYQRAVGFFSSTILSQITVGIISIAQRGGSIQIVASPKLSEEDIAAIKKGYELRHVVRNAVLRELIEPQNIFEEQHLNLLANLIADGILDIKIAFTERNMQAGMYHEKMGLMSDDEGNTVAFSGSMNESAHALALNYEAIDVFCSWKSDEQHEKVQSKRAAFKSIWNNSEPNITIVDFPDLSDEIINRFMRSKVDYCVDETLYSLPVSVSSKKHWLQVPAGLEFFDYQIEAMNEWKANNFCGIFDMATGTGKTLTALGALEILSRTIQDRVGVFIICPYQHLVEQWLEDIVKFGITPLICYSAYDWKKNFKTLLSDFRYGVINNFCVITTNVTFATDYFQNEIDRLHGNLCLIVDEAHNFGAKRQLDCMKELFTYRLALSATLERHFDEPGTQRLKDFFGKKCIEYSLEKAIQEDKLTPYYYYPIPIHFDEDELDAYNELTEKIINILCKVRSDTLPKSAEMLLIQRARIVAAARNKLKELYDIIRENYKDDNQMLIYCGATTVENSSYIEGKVDDEEKRQIDIVVDMLGNQLNMRVSKFTSEESAKERARIKEDFRDGVLLQALVAIRCLDEGVNIPGIRTAFILASSTNPKEYIQRRGRVLRKAAGKRFARIYDFITLPRDINQPRYGIQHLDSEFSLIRREFERMEDFAKLAENSSEFTKLKDKVKDYYNLYYAGGKDYGI